MRNLYNLALYFFVHSVVSQMQFGSLQAHQMTYSRIGVDYSRDPSGPIYKDAKLNCGYHHVAINIHTSGVLSLECLLQPFQALKTPDEHFSLTLIRKHSLYCCYEKALI